MPAIQPLQTDQLNFQLQMFNFKTMDMPSFDQLRASFLPDRINGSHSLDVLEKIKYHSCLPLFPWCETAVR